jgi:ferredoxin
LARVTITGKGTTASYELRAGLGFQALCAKHATPIEFDCRGADCGICVLRITAGREHLSPPTREEADFLKAMRAAPDERLACQCRVMGDCSVQVEDP